MKLQSFLVVVLGVANAVSQVDHNQAVLGSSEEADKYLIELSPGETRWVTEDQKWELKRVIFHL